MTPQPSSDNPSNMRENNHPTLVRQCYLYFPLVHSPVGASDCVLYTKLIMKRVLAFIFRYPSLRCSYRMATYNVFKFTYLGHFLK